MHAAAQAAAALAAQPSPLPWWWVGYSLLTGIAWYALGLFSVQSMAALLTASNRYDGWEEDFSVYLGLLVLVSVGLWARHRHLVAVSARLRDRDEPQGAA